ncbi:MAG: nitrilase-related carbon-nitrogen hydrolase [Cyanobacteriota bacterium]|nr:nitrilase-related carbon-nitrogen hydrolase [Cyanobacteriota bacterium]
MADDRRPTDPAQAGWPAALLAGALAGLALPPLGLPLLLWPALAMLWGLSRQRSLLPLLWGAAAVLLSHRWLLWLHPLSWLGVPGPLSLPLCGLLWGLVGLAGGLLVAAWAELVRRLDATRPSTALLAAALWGLAEVALAHGPLFWIGLGAAALPGDAALAGLARLGGAGLLAAVQLLLGWSLWRLWCQRRPGQGRRSAVAVALALLLASHLLGLQQLRRAAAAPSGSPVPLLVLQPAIPTRRKFEAREQALLRQRLGAALAEAAAAMPAPVLLLPEGALALGQALPGPAPVEVLAGGFRLEGSSLRSSLLRHHPGEPAPSGWIDKHRLVPLGEWVPLAALLRWSGLSAVGGLEPGAAPRLLPRPDGAIAVAICYEIADGLALADAAHAGASWLLASANLDPYPLSLHAQFVALARLRALETGRWLASAANTGPSLVVDPAAGLHPGPAPLTAATAALQLHTSQARTGYLRWREGPLLLLLLAGLGVRRWGAG